MMLDECTCPLCSSQDEQGGLMNNRYYQPCARCGNPQAGDRARTLRSGRLVCGTCYEEELPVDERFCVVDDLVCRSWQETLELRRNAV